MTKYKKELVECLLFLSGDIDCTDRCFRIEYNKKSLNNLRFSIINMYYFNLAETCDDDDEALEIIKKYKLTRKSYKNKFVKRVKKYHSQYKEDLHWESVDPYWVMDKRKIDYGNEIWMDRFYLNSFCIYNYRHLEKR